MLATGLEFTVEDLVECRIHRVTPDFVQEYLDADLPDFSIDDIIAARIHRMRPSFLKEYREAGFEEWTPDDLAGFHELHVPAEYVRGMFDAGIVERDEILKAYRDGVAVEDVNTILRNGD